MRNSGQLSDVRLYYTWLIYYILKKILPESTFINSQLPFVENTEFIPVNDFK